MYYVRVNSECNLLIHGLFGSLSQITRSSIDAAELTRWEECVPKVDGRVGPAKLDVFFLLFSTFFLDVCVLFFTHFSLWFSVRHKPCRWWCWLDHFLRTFSSSICPPWHHAHTCAARLNSYLPVWTFSRHVPRFSHMSRSCYYYRWYVPPSHTSFLFCCLFLKLIFL